MMPITIPFLFQDLAAAGIVALAIGYILRRVRKTPQKEESCATCGGASPSSESR